MMAENEQKSWTKRFGGIFGFGFVGGVVGYFGGKWLVGYLGPENSPELDISAVVAGTIAAIYLILAAMVGVGAAFPRWGAKFLNTQDIEELMEQRTMLLASAGAMALSGIALGIVVLGDIIGLPALVTAIVFFAAMLAALASYWPMRSGMDELYWRVSYEAVAYCYYALLAIGGSWAVLAHLELVTGPQMLDWLSMFWGLMLIATFVATGRRGMLE